MSKNAARRELGLRITELRRQRRFSQLQLAELADLSLRYLQLIEAADANPSLDTLLEIAGALRCELRELFERPTLRRPRRGRPSKTS